jgi:hypothetical protein
MHAAVDSRGDPPGRWADIDGLLLRGGSLVGSGFEPGEDVKSVLHDMVHVLVVGAGGLGCELLKDLALSGFKKIDVIDMDTIDVSNLNRQFLFTSKDVGQSKALCAARAVERRVAGVVVTPHHCRIEEKPDEWYKQFHVIVLGLDSIEARSYVNKVACSFMAFDKDGNVDQGVDQADDRRRHGGIQRPRARVVTRRHAVFRVHVVALSPASSVPAVHFSGDTAVRRALHRVRAADPVAERVPSETRRGGGEYRDAVRLGGSRV